MGGTEALEVAFGGVVEDLQSRRLEGLSDLSEEIARISETAYYIILISGPRAECAYSPLPEWHPPSVYSTLQAIVMMP